MEPKQKILFVIVGILAVVGVAALAAMMMFSSGSGELLTGSIGGLQNIQKMGLGQAPTYP